MESNWSQQRIVRLLLIGLHAMAVEYFERNLMKQESRQLSGRHVTSSNCATFSTASACLLPTCYYKVLLVEGPNDIPVYKAFLEKAPSNRGQNIPVLSLGGTSAAGRNFDASHWSNLHPKARAILDSERRAPDEDPDKSRKMSKQRLEAAGIPCLLTERRATGNYLAPRALTAVFGHAPYEVDPFGDPNLSVQGVTQFEKRRNREVARAMEWSDIENTDVGTYIEGFLKD
jgi:hypothetical protein